MKNKKEKGFTLMELIFALAITAIIASMVGPLLTSMNKVNEKETVINKLDSNLGKAVELIKRTARTAKRDAKVTPQIPAIKTSTDGAIIRMNVPIEKNSDITQSLVVFRVNGTNLEIGSSDNNSNDPTTYDVIAENITAHNFRYDDDSRVLRMYLKIDINKYGENYDWKKREISDSAVTRIDFGN